MFVTGNHGMFAAFQCFLYFGETAACVVRPDGVVHKKVSPAHIRVFFQRFQHKIGLLAGEVVIIVVVAVENDEQHVFVIKIVVPFSVSFFPLFFHHFVGDIVVAGQVKKRHLQVRNNLVHLVPLFGNQRCVGSVTRNQIAHAHHKFGHHQVEFFHTFFKYTRSVSAVAVGDNGKLKISRVVVKIEVGPRFFLCINIGFEIFHLGVTG